MRQTGVKQIARQRIQTLLDEAKNAYRSNPEMAMSYVRSARRIAMAARMRLPVDFRRQTCRKCNSLLVEGSNCRVRVKQKREPHVVITCLNCGNQTRIMLRKRMEQEQVEHQDKDKNEAPR